MVQRAGRGGRQAGKEGPEFVVGNRRASTGWRLGLPPPSEGAPPQAHTPLGQGCSASVMVLVWLNLTALRVVVAAVSL